MAHRFLDDDVFLSTEPSRWLFHEVAAPVPIVDIHTHLPAADIASNRVYDTLADLWLEDDHYKWRAMRLAGWPEQLITGDAEPWDKFRAWAETVPRLPHNPLYLWTHLELATGLRDRCTPIARNSPRDLGRGESPAARVVGTPASLPLLRRHARDH